jgi:hypothetical protein
VDESWFVVWGPFLLAGVMLIGIPVYAVQRSRMSEPAAVPLYR